MSPLASHLLRSETAALDRYTPTKWSPTYRQVCTCHTSATYLNCVKKLYSLLPMTYRRLLLASAHVMLGEWEQAADIVYPVLNMTLLRDLTDKQAIKILLPLLRTLSIILVRLGTCALYQRPRL